MTDDTLPKKRGRPPLEANGPSVTLNVRLPSKQFDEMCRRAMREQISLGEVIRRAVEFRGRKIDG